MRQGMNGAQDTFSYGNKVKGVVERKDKKRKVFWNSNPPPPSYVGGKFVSTVSGGLIGLYIFGRGSTASWAIIQREDGGVRGSGICVHLSSNGCCSDKM